MGLLFISLRLVLLLVINLSAITLLPASLLGVLPSLATDPTLNEPENQPNKLANSTTQRSSVSVPTVARLVTVRILANQGAGSGVIVERQGQTYTVLTNAHVVAEAADNLYTILTADGRTHTGRWLKSTNFNNQDLALVQFTSKQTYQVAVIGNSDALSVGDPIYASGFPNWRLLNSTTLADTQDWGLKAFQLTKGNVGMLSSKPLQQGYQLGYTNQIEHGMSGGPVLDQDGQLVGVNGQLKYPPQGIIAFIFADGTMPSEAAFQQMEPLSWAIPSANFRNALKQPKASSFGHLGNTF